MSNIEKLWPNHCCRGNPVSILYSKCVSLALVIQHEKRMHHNILSSVACLSQNILPHYHINGMIFGKKVIYHKMCVLIFYTNFVWNFLILRRNGRDIIKNVYKSSCKVTKILVRFHSSLDFFYRDFEKYSYIRFLENQSIVNLAVQCG